MLNRVSPQSVNQLENLCGIIARKISSSLLPLGLNQLETVLGQKLSNKNQLQIEQFNVEYLQDVIKALIMQTVVNYLENVKGDHEALPSTVIVDLLKNVGNVIQQHIHSEAIDIEYADFTRRDKDLNKAFTPMAKALLELLRSPKSDKKEGVPLTLPFPAILELFWSEIEATVVPNLLGQLYLDTTSWTSEIEVNRKELTAQTGSTVLSEVCRVMGSWTAIDFLPAFFFNSREDFGRTVTQTLQQQFLGSTSPESLSFEVFLAQNEAKIKEQLTSEFYSAFTPGNALMTESGPIAAKYIESTLLKILQGLVNKVDNAENFVNADNNKKEFLLNLGVDLFNITSEHFKIMNEATKTAGKSQPHQVNYGDFVKQFTSADKLTEGVPKVNVKAEIKKMTALIKKERKILHKLTDPDKKNACRARIKKAQEELRIASTKENTERAAFFEPFTKKFLELVGITKENIPFPNDLKDQLWELLTTSLLPNVFGSLFSLILNPTTLNNILITSLENMNASLDAPQGPPVSPAPHDAMQDKIDTACGELILQLTNMIPTSLVKTAFKIDQVKAISRKAIGRAIRTQLGENWTLLKMLEKGAMSGLPNMQKGEWNEGMFEETPNQPAPTTQEGIEAAEYKKIIDEELTEAKTRAIMVSTARRIIGDAIENTYKIPFSYFLKKWNALVDKVFGSYSRKIRSFFNYIGDLAIFKFIDLIRVWLGKPFKFVAWTFVDLYVDFRAKNIVKNLQLDINENLLYKLMDQFVTSLTPTSVAHLKPLDNLIAPFLQAADLHDIEQMEEAAEFRHRWEVSPES